MEHWEHHRANHDASQVAERIRDLVRVISEEAGKPPRHMFQGSVVLRRPSAEDGFFQFYVPAVRVAGQGRCACEASLEALEQFEAILHSVHQHKDWSIIPPPDHSLSTKLAELQTRVFVAALALLTRPYPAQEVREVRAVNSALTAAAR